MAPAPLSENRSLATRTATSLAKALAWATAIDPRAACWAPDRLQGRGGIHQQQLSGADVGGKAPEALNHVRVGGGHVGPSRPGRLEERASAGAYELGGVAQRPAGDPDLDRRVNQLGAGAQLLGNQRRCTR